MPTDADALDWFTLFDDAGVMRHIGDGSVRPLEWYRSFVTRQQELAAETGLCLFSVVRTDGLTSGEPDHSEPSAASDASATSSPVLRVDVVAGFVGLQPWSEPWGPTGSLELGWRLGAAHQGQGLATSAARLCLTRAITRGILNPVSMIHAENAASIAVARRIGMTPQSHLTSPLGVAVVEYGFDRRR